MEPAILRFVLDSSVLVAERNKLTTPEAIRKVREAAGDVTIVICSLTVAELGHIYRADTPERSCMRRQIIVRIGAELARWSWATPREPSTSAILTAFLA